MIHKRLQIGLTLLLLTVWGGYVTWSAQWVLFDRYWPIALTMAFSSFVGSATPLGGGAVAFPIFTKVLEISSAESRTFALMIQCMGMGMASVLIVTRRIPTAPQVIRWVSLGGAGGMIIGLFWLPMPAPLPKLLFTCIATVFVLVLVSVQLGNQTATSTALSVQRMLPILFVIVGLLGGILSANIGVGINLLTFIVLTLAFGLDARINVPTSVIIMAINAAVGFIILLGRQEIGIVWEYWLVAIPVAVIGAPLGAYVVSRVSRAVILVALCALTGVELITTLWLIPLSSEQWRQMGLIFLFVLVALGLMIRFRQRNIVAQSRRILRDNL